MGHCWMSWNISWGNSSVLLPNQRMKLPRRGGHSWWNWFILIVATPPRSLCAIRSMRAIGKGGLRRR